MKVTVRQPGGKKSAIQIFDVPTVDGKKPRKRRAIAYLTVYGITGHQMLALVRDALERHATESA